MERQRKSKEITSRLVGQAEKPMGWAHTHVWRIKGRDIWLWR